MNIRQIEYASEEYDEMVSLRSRILRIPLGLTFSEQDLDKDKHDFLFGSFSPDSKQLVACCILTPLNEDIIQLRQMAVDSSCQSAGLGSELLAFVERFALQKGFSYLYLHARKTAVDFYKKNGYCIEGSQFTEVGIPHLQMKKILSTRNG